MKNGVYAMVVEDILHKKVTGGLVANAPVIFTSELRVELLSSKKEKDISIPELICRYDEHVFVEERIINNIPLGIAHNNQGIHRESHLSN